MSTDPSAPGATSAGAPGPGPGSNPGGPGPGGQPSEEELRAAYEAELARITSTDMMLQSAVSLLNVASYRLMPRPPAAGAAGAEQPGAGQDLEQVRDAIDGVRALLEILERRVPSELRPLRDALSQLQMAYAREAQAAGQAVGGESAASGAPSAGPAAEPAGPGSGEVPPPPSANPGPGAPGPAGGSQGQGDPAQAPDEEGKRGPGPAESSGRLWVPGR